MEFFFYPSSESSFKSKAVCNLVKTLVFNKNTLEIELLFSRKVNKLWTQTCKNNIQTDHRIKDLPGNHYQIYSWVSKNDESLELPSFAVFD